MSTFETWKVLRLPLAAVGISYVFLAALSPILAPKLIFHPEYGSSRVPSGLRKIPGENGELAVLYLPNPGAEFTLWYFHGNAEDLGDIEPVLREFQEAGFSVFAAEYPGYGHSSGQPSEASVYSASRMARKFLRDELKVPAARTILYGHSLGGGVATQLATEEKVAGLALQSTFVTAFRVLTRWPLLPFDQFKNINKLSRVSSPVLIMHGTADQVIGFHHGGTLAAAVRGPKQVLWVNGAGHNDLREVAGKKFWNALSAFRDLCRNSVGSSRP